ncbi:MAG TPA: hypothetical protein VGF91_30545 [Solirubrobacteraceae bacterium]|jgi:hypothetical protein
MFNTIKYILAAAVVTVAAAAPSGVLADTPAASSSAPTVSQIVVTKTVDAPTPKVVRTAVTGKYIVPAR